MAKNLTEEYFKDLFYRRLLQFRLGKGVSAREMSLALGQAPGYINNIENRKGLPSMASFFYICLYLGVTPEEFFEEENSSPEQLRELVENLQKLDKEQLSNILALVLALGK